MTFSINKLNIVILLLCCLGVSQLFSIAIVNLAIVGCIILLVVSMNINDMIVGLFATLPFFNLFNVSVGNISLYYLIALGFIFKYVINKGWRLPKSKFMWLFVLAILKLSSTDITGTLTWLVLFSVFVITYNDSIFINNIEKIIKYITISTIISSFYGYVMVMTGSSIYTGGRVYSQGVMTVRLAGLIGDSVMYGQFLAIIVACNLVIMVLNETIDYKKIICCAILVLFACLTYSKTAVLLVLGVILLWVLYIVVINSKSKKTLYVSIIVIVLFVVAIISLISYIVNNPNNSMVQNYIIRFTAEDLWTGRFDIVNHYITLIFSDLRNIFIAMDYDIYKSGIAISSGYIIKDTHNIYVETMCMFGVIASIIMFCWCIKVIFLHVKRKGNIFALVPITALLASGFSLHGHMEFQFYTIVALSFVFISPLARKYYNGRYGTK